MTRVQTLWRNLGPRRTIQFVIVCLLLYVISGIVAYQGQLGSPILVFPAMFVLAWVWREKLVDHANEVGKVIPYVWFVLFAAAILGRKYVGTTPWAAYALFSLAGLYMAVTWTVFSDPRIVVRQRNET